MRIPNLTPAFDPNFYTNGLNEKAIDFILKQADSMVCERRVL